MATDSVVSLLPGGGGGGGSVSITLNAAENIDIGEPVSISDDGEFELFNGTKPCFGIAEATVIATQGLTVKSSGKFNGSTITYPDTTSLQKTAQVPDLTTAALANSGLVVANARSNTVIDGNGLSAFVVDQGDVDKLKQFRLNGSYDTSTVTLELDEQDFNTSDFGQTNADYKVIGFSHDGMNFYAATQTGNILTQFALRSPYNVYGRTKVAAIKLSHTLTFFDISPCGNYLLVYSSATDTLYLYKLERVNNIGKLMFQNSLAASFVNYESFIFTEDPGEILAGNGTTVYRYGMSTDRDFSTINTTALQSFTVGQTAISLGLRSGGGGFYAGDSTIYNYTTTDINSTHTIASGTNLYASFNGTGVTDSKTGDSHYIGYKITDSQVLLNNSSIEA